MMIPDLSAPLPQTGLSVGIKSVSNSSGKNTSWWDRSYISAQTFDHALVDYLQSTGAFRSVSRDTSADLIISADIMEQTHWFNDYELRVRFDFFRRDQKRNWARIVTEKIDAAFSDEEQKTVERAARHILVGLGEEIFRLSSARVINAEDNKPEMPRSEGKFPSIVRELPSKNFVPAIQAGVESIAFANVAEDGSLFAYEQFLERYPQGKFAESARLEIQRIWLNKANTIGALEDFLLRFPQGSLAEKARKDLAAAHARRDKVENVRKVRVLCNQVEPSLPFADAVREEMEGIGLRVVNSVDTSFDATITVTAEASERTVEYAAVKTSGPVIYVQSGTTTYGTAKLTPAEERALKERSGVKDIRCGNVLKGHIDITLPSMEAPVASAAFFEGDECPSPLDGETFRRGGIKGRSLDELFTTCFLPTIKSFISGCWVDERSFPAAEEYQEQHNARSSH